MLHHAEALADSGTHVELIGHRGCGLPSAVANHPRIEVHWLAPPRRHEVGSKSYVRAAFADLWRDTATLARLARSLPPLDAVLVQNPPAFPSLVLAHLLAKRKRARLVVDWHNFAEDMLALRLGRRHPMVRWLGKLEGTLGRRAHAHLCVSQAMQRELRRRLDIEGARVFYDRPPPSPPALPAAARADLFRQLDIELDPNDPRRPPIIVSASSWSADDDFSLLLETMQLLDAQGFACWFLLTGDGPGRVAWEVAAKGRAFRHVRYRTLWVPADQYLHFLSAADLGLSLHRSASGFDLPMKICDMKAAGLAVAALDYGPVLREYLRPGENGILFGNARELARELLRVFERFPRVSDDVLSFRASAERERADAWHAGWLREAREVLL